MSSYPEVSSQKGSLTALQVPYQLVLFCFHVLKMLNRILYLKML